MPIPSKQIDKNKSFAYASASNSHKKYYPSSSKNTTTKFFTNNENLEHFEKIHNDSSIKANNILKYYDKFLNLKAKSQKNNEANTYEEPEHNILFQNQQEIKIKPTSPSQEKEISGLKQEITKFNDKFLKLQENMEFLMEKQLDIQKSLEFLKDDNNVAKNLQAELLNEKKVEIQENEDENFATSKIYSKLEEFLTRLNEENDKIVDENNNLKNILEIKVNSLEEKFQRITEKNVQEENFEKVCYHISFIVHLNLILRE